MADYEAHAIIGRKHTGKSTFAHSFFKGYNLKKDRVLIITETDPGAYSKIKRIDNIEMLRAWKSGVLKYYDFDCEDDFSMLIDVYKLAAADVLNNGLVIFEDCTNYIDPNPHRVIKKFIVNHRMYRLDLIFTTHSLAFLPKFCRRMVSTITIFKTLDTFSRWEDLRALGYPNAQNLYSAWVQVMNNKNEHFSITISTGL